MNVTLVVVGVMGLAVLSSMTAWRVEKGWRVDAEQRLSACEAGRKGVDAAAGAARDAARSDDPVSELLRRFGR